MKQEAVINLAQYIYQQFKQLHQTSALIALCTLITACGGGGGGGGGGSNNTNINNGSSGNTNQTPPTVSAPVINTHPQSANITEGQSYTLSVSATGSDIAYQWLKNDSPIGGANASTYQLNSVSLSDDNSYYSVKVSNSGGEVTSAYALIQVVAAPPPPTPSPTPTPSFESVTLTWLAPTQRIDASPLNPSDINAYNIYISTDNVNYSYSTSAAGNLTSATINGLSSGNTYYFVITTVDDNGSESSQSSPVSIDL